jgi:hypothetical protein
MEHQSAPPENNNLTPKQRRFLHAFAATARINQAAVSARVAKQSHYTWMEESEEYRRAFQQVHTTIGDLAEDACVERAIFGVEKPVLFQGKQVKLNGRPLFEREYSDQLLITLLRRLKPQEYREHTAIQVSGSLNLTELTERMRAGRRRILQMEAKESA